MNDTHQVDGIDFLCSPITFDDGTASTLVGGTVKAYARHSSGAPSYVGSVTDIQATSCRVTFAGGMVVGTYTVQVIATPAGYQPQTISESQWRVDASFGAA